MKRSVRLLSLFSAALLVTAVAVQLLPPRVTYAATELEPRSLTLQQGTFDTDGDGIPDGGSLPSGHVTHLFSFTLSNITQSVGSIKFQYCTTAAPVTGGINCNAPAGIDTSGANLATQTGVAGFVSTTSGTEDDANDSINNVVVIGRGSASTIGPIPVAATYQFTGVINPSAVNTTFFVRISTYTALDGTGTAIESGTVAASTTSAGNIKVSGTMPESLVFCTGATISETNSVPDCTTATGGTISFNRLFDPTSTAFTTSQMAASTNAGQGYAITVGGPTLSSGTNTIAAMSTTDTSKFGISQFGLDLVANDGTAYTNAPNITGMPVGYADSADIAPASNGTNYNGIAQAGFATAGSFTFNGSALNTVAKSDWSGTGPTGTPIGTDSQIYTVSYIVNVPGSQPAGTYNTTLTYICTPTF